MQDFRTWLMLNVDPNEPEEVRCLYNAVREGGSTDTSPWEVSWKGDKMFVRCADRDWLPLVSESARSTFLEMMDEMFSHGMGIETWADCELAIANDKS